MASHLSTYINFSGQAREALTFYHSVFGGELSVVTYAEFQASDDPADADKLMHGSIITEHGFRLMAADTPSFMDSAPISGVSIMLEGDDEALLTDLYEQLSVGGTITEQLARAPWGDTYGSFVDRFGVSWMVNIDGSGTQA